MNTQKINQFDSLKKACDTLKEKGFKENFIITEDVRLKDERGVKYRPNEVHVKEYHRFEGESNPAEMSILYAIRTEKGSKGIIIEPYGTEDSTRIDSFMDKCYIPKMV